MTEKKKKRKPRKRSKAAPESDETAEADVHNLDAKRAEKLLEGLRGLMEDRDRAIDEGVELVVDSYREWEAHEPSLCLDGREKIAMVRLGFVGSVGFDRCHEPDRLPESAFADTMLFLEEMDEESRGGLMCPAMESRKCQEIWRAMEVPPCRLLLLEIHHGIGGGFDERVQNILEDLDRFEEPEAYAESFARAERVMGEHEGGE